MRTSNAGRHYRTVVALLATWVIFLAGRAMADDDPLATLRPNHPRLLVLNEDLDAARSAGEKHPVARMYLNGLKDSAKKMLDQPPAEHKLIGPRMLAQSRLALSRITTLGTLYRLEGDRKYAERARKELLAVVAFKDWNPSHFLDTAEMSAAVGIGYDWFYDYLSPEDRATIRHGLVELGLKPGLKAYAAKRPPVWTTARHNWAQVCSGGLFIGALAIADEEPDIARQIIPLTHKTIERAMTTFAPDGGWPEGPGYWAYATQYNVYYIAAAQSALGTDFGLKSMPGFSDTGNFRIQSIGPLGKMFNFADAGENSAPTSQMYWLARQFNHPEYAAAERENSPRWSDPFGLLWFAGRGSTDKLPLDACFRGVNVAFFRSAFDDMNAWYVGFKGGDNRANHAHLDLGTFVLDALGQRWVCDLGPDDYNLPDYFGKKRWDYYRLRTEGHNTLSIDNANQPPTAKAPLIAYSSTPDRAYAVADLSNAYPDAEHVVRGVALLHRNSVLVQDEFTADKELPLVWAIHTQAEVSLSDARNVATLHRGDESIEMRILEPNDAKFETSTPKLDPPQTPLKHVTKITLRPAPAKTHRIAVLFIAKGGTSDTSIEPLQKWIDAAPLK